MSLAEIRVNIDRVDSQLRELFVERMGLSEQVVTTKAKTSDKIYKGEREIEILDKNTALVEPRLQPRYRSFIKRIMDVSREYQYGRMLELNDCFPFTYEKEAVNFSKTAVLAKDNRRYVPFTVKEVAEVGTYEKAAELILEGKADSGIALMEQIGSGVDHALDQMMIKHNFYFNACVKPEFAPTEKWVVYSKHLTVLPEDNRLKFMFTCKNEPGGLSNTLAIISDYGTNITEMHTEPFMEKDGWDYHFYLELKGNLDDPDIKALIFQLTEETTSFHLLGSYQV